MKYLILLIIFLGLYAPVNAEALKGGVSYTVDEARVKAFSNVPLKIDMNEYKKYFKDPNYEENKKAIAKGGKCLRKKNITVYLDKGYSISYKNKKNITFYYDKNGKLENIDIDYKKTFPMQSAKYDINGNLDSTCLGLENYEQYMFDRNQKLRAHWIGNNCYNENGELINIRE